MDIVAVSEEVFAIAHAAISESSLPDFKIALEPVREPTFDELHGSFERDLLRGKQEMDMVRHNDEGM